MNNVYIAASWMFKCTVFTIYDNYVRVFRYIRILIVPPVHYFFHYGAEACLWAVSIVFLYLFCLWNRYCKVSSTRPIYKYYYNNFSL